VKTVTSKRALAEEAWRSFIDFAWTRKSHGIGQLKELGLTPGHLKVLILLSEDTAPTMGSLADERSAGSSSVEPAAPIAGSRRSRSRRRARR
jgi:DNA-binding MarR family transcriptional regulator